MQAVQDSTNNKTEAMPDMGFIYSLLHDDRGSFYARPSKTKNGWREGNAVTKDVLCENLSHGKFARKADQYISCAGFTTNRRGQINLRQINSVLIDIDHHIDDASERDAAIATDSYALLQSFAFGDFAVHPEIAPTYVVHSGRGLQLWYILDRSIPIDGTEGSERAQGLRNVFIDLAWKYFEKTLGVEPDKACGDVARVGRIPGTWNSEAECYAQVYCDSGHLVSLSDAVRVLKELISEKENLNAEDATKHRKIENFNPLLHDRAAALRALQRQRLGNERLRNETLFAYAECVVREYSKENAREAVEVFNAGFNRPLPKFEVAHVFKSAWSRFSRNLKTYGAKKLIEHLGITPEEASKFFGYTTSREIERAEKRAKRAERDQKIAQMLAEGISFSKIAEAVGVDKRTITRHAKAIKEAKNYQKSSWERLLAAKKGASGTFSPSFRSECSDKNERLTCGVNSFAFESNLALASGPPGG